MNYAFLEFKDKKKYLGLIILELVFATLTVASFLNLFGLNVLQIAYYKNFVFAVSTSMLDFALFASSLIIFAILFFAIKRRIPVIYGAQQKAFSEIKFDTMRRIGNAKTDPRIMALLLIEFMFVVIVFVSISAFFDPETELIPWGKLGLEAPFTTIINAILAILVLAGFYWLYRQTSYFRQGKQPVSEAIAKKAVSSNNK